MLSENYDILIYSIVILMPTLFLHGNSSIMLNGRRMVDTSVSNFKRNL